MPHIYGFRPVGVSNPHGVPWGGLCFQASARRPPSSPFTLWCYTDFDHPFPMGCTLCSSHGRRPACWDLLLVMLCQLQRCCACLPFFFKVIGIPPLSVDWPPEFPNLGNRVRFARTDSFWSITTLMCWLCSGGVPDRGPCSQWMGCLSSARHHYTHCAEGCHTNVELRVWWQ